MSPIVKKKGEKFTLPGKYLLFILTILCVALMILTYSTNVISAPLSNVAGFIIIPFQKGITEVGSAISDRLEQFTQIQNLLEENKALQAQVDELTTENTNLQQDKFELSELRELYDLNQQYSDYEMVGAKIISKDAGNWYHTFVIDKGSDDGIQIDMNVIAGSGLVGRVISVGSNWAKVNAIINDNTQVSGMVLSTSDNLIVSGDLENFENGVIAFNKLVDSEAKVVVGDKIVTSNISDKYLPGILIGYISTLNTDSNNLTKSGYLTPAVDFTHLNEVLVILQLKQQVEE
ncbi:MAG: rod shape-determining protein MreC [Lachnospiraceae bacterium]|nr:rod shape-determining protein MreC [Lachnospiraceae bacterium]